MAALVFARDEARGWLFLRFFCTLWFYALDVITSAKEALMYGAQVEMSLEDGEWKGGIQGQRNGNGRTVRGLKGG